MTKKSSQYHVFAIIPARGGSKGVPRKNIKLINGKPLLFYTIESAKQSKFIDAFAVSTDDPEIAQIANELGAPIISRPPSLAQDSSPMLPVIEHSCLEYERTSGEKITHLVLLQPTSPLRSSKDIDSALSIVVKQNAKAVISVVESDNKVLKHFMMTPNGQLSGLIDNETPFKQRQQLPKVFAPNGAIYIYEKTQLLNSREMLPLGTYPYIMQLENSLDIDTDNDFDIAAQLLNSHRW